YLTGLGDMYVADPRFGANYGGVEGATFVRDALRVYADRNL
ncbi:MAG TPA: TipAS antibiotic-recognition domain-containing protein, partial [Leifsonia sp.]